MIELISNTTTEDRYTILIGKRVQSCPKAGWNDIRVRKYELPYHPTRLRFLKSVVSLGTAVALRGQLYCLLTTSQLNRLTNNVVVNGQNEDNRHKADCQGDEDEVIALFGVIVNGS